MNRLLVAAAVSTAMLSVVFVDTATSQSADKLEYPPMQPTSAFLGSEFEKDLSELGITYTDLGPVPLPEGLDARQAVQEQFGAILAVDGAYTVQSVRFTDENFGTSLDPDSVDAPFKPYFVDQAAEMLTLTHQRIPVSVPEEPDGDPAQTQLVADSTFVAFVNAETGDVLRAVSFSQPINP
jgi:hypothetical protein